MGEYLTIIWESESPSATAVQWDRCGLVVHGSEASLSETTVYACTNDNWGSTLTSAGFGTSSQAYKSTADFFSASPIPGGNLYIIALVSGTVTNYSNVPMLKVTDRIWETPIKPPLGFYGDEEVRYYPDKDLTGYWVNAADGSVGLGFTVEEDGFSNWTGRLNFVSGLSGYQIDNPPRDGCKITCSFKVGSAASDVGEQVEELKLNMLAAAYENDSTKEKYEGTNTYYGSMVNDLSTFTNAVAGKNCIFFWALPGNANPQETGYELGDIWANFKNVVGSLEYVAPIKASPSALNDDMAAGYMGMAAGEHPHSTLSFKTIHMGISAPEGFIDRSYWNDAQIASAMTRPELSGSPNLITHGFTLGTGYGARINYVRCKNIIAQELKNTLWALLASRKVRMSYEGMMLVKSTIEGLFKRLKDQDIIDEVGSVSIPVATDLKANNAAGKAARAAREIPSITITFYWYSTLEKITITGIRNDA